MNSHRKLRMGMIGGGEGSFIGGVHRIAAFLDGQIELVCGAFNKDAAKSKKSGHDLFLPEHRVYSDYDEMLKSEAELKEEERMDFVAIVTPNVAHYDPAIKALNLGLVEAGTDPVDPPSTKTLLKRFLDTVPNRRLERMPCGAPTELPLARPGQTVSLAPSHFQSDAFHEASVHPPELSRPVSTTGSVAGGTG